MISAIGGFFGRMFGSPKAGEQIIEGVSSAADKLFYTEEEKADDRAKAKSEGYQVYMQWLISTSGSRIARRVIALSITIPWSLAQSMSWILDSVAPFIKGTETIKQRIDGQIVDVIVLNSDKWAAAADSMAANASENNGLVGVVLLYYFGGPMAADAIPALISKWVDKKPQAKPPTARPVSSKTPLQQNYENEVNRGD